MKTGRGWKGVDFRAVMGELRLHENDDLQL